MIGKKFNRLTVLESKGSDKNGNKIWLCKCECGNEKIVTSSHIKSGHTKSCGCFGKELGRKQFTTHGMVGTATYRSWAGMKNRCTNRNDPHWERYGGRGITVCDQWINSFETYYADMGDSPFKGAEIDRIDNMAGYSPENCRWVDRATNSRNRRNNIVVEYQGDKMCLAEASRLSGIGYGTLKSRIRRGYGDELFTELLNGKPQGSDKGRGYSYAASA